MDSRSRLLAGLVEDEHVGLLQHQAAENQAGLLAAGKCRCRLQGIFAAEKHLTHGAANFLLGGLRLVLPEPLHGGDAFALVDGVAKILGEIADSNFVAPDDVAGIDGEGLLGAGNELTGIADQRLQHGGFAGAIASDQGDFFAAGHAGRKILEDSLPIVGLGQVLDLDWQAARWALGVETNVWALNIGALRARRFAGAPRFFARRGLRGTGAGREAGDEVVELRNFLSRTALSASMRERTFVLARTMSS